MVGAASSLSLERPQALNDAALLQQAPVSEAAYKHGDPDKKVSCSSGPNWG
jgi:hypothetical protein